jgi:hypothetical protein
MVAGAGPSDPKVRWRRNCARSRGSAMWTKALNGFPGTDSRARTTAAILALSSSVAARRNVALWTPAFRNSCGSAGLPGMTAAPDSSARSAAAALNSGSITTTLSPSRLASSASSRPAPLNPQTIVCLPFRILDHSRSCLPTTNVAEAAHMTARTLAARKKAGGPPSGPLRGICRTRSWTLGYSASKKVFQSSLSLACERRMRRCRWQGSLGRSWPTR